MLDACQCVCTKIIERIFERSKKGMDKSYGVEGGLRGQGVMELFGKKVPSDAQDSHDSLVPSESVSCNGHVRFFERVLRNFSQSANDRCPRRRGLSTPSLGGGEFPRHGGSFPRLIPVTRVTPRVHDFDRISARKHGAKQSRDRRRAAKRGGLAAEKPNR